MNQPALAASARKAIHSVLVAAAATAGLGAPEWAHGTPTLSEVLGELARSWLIACVLSRLLEKARARTWNDALRLGLGVCVFQLIILLGSLLHEHMPLAAYALRGAFAVGATLAAVAVLRLFQGQPTGAAGAEPGHARADVNYKALCLGAVAALIVGGLWYSPWLFGGAWAHLKAGASTGGARMPPIEVLGELVRSGIVAYLLSRFILSLRLSVKGSLLLGSGMWLGFHATLLLFSVIHEHMPMALFAIHAGHGLANDLVIAAIVGTWRHKVNQPVLLCGGRSIPGRQGVGQ